MPIELFAVYVAACAFILVTPGPNTLLCINHSVRFGAGRTFWTSLGSVAGALSLIAASMAGLGALLLASEAAFTAVKWIGAAYLLWLAFETWRAPSPATMPSSGQTLSLSWRRVFLRGLAVSISNPKALIFFATFLPQFIRPGEPLMPQFFILASTFAGMQLAYEVAIALTARRLGGWLIRNSRAFNRVTAGVFVGIAGMVLTSERAR